MQMLGDCAYEMDKVVQSLINNNNLAEQKFTSVLRT